MKRLLMVFIALSIAAMAIYAGSRPKAQEQAVQALPEAVSKAAAPAQKIKVTFVELGSVNCKPCKMMVPVMKAVEEKYGSQVKVVFHDVWTAAGQPYAQQYGIRGIPTQVFLDENGKEYYRHMGYFPIEQLVEILKQGGVKVD